jgi:hypothetical protein
MNGGMLFMNHWFRPGIRQLLPHQRVVLYGLLDGRLRIGIRHHPWQVRVVGDAYDLDEVGHYNSLSEPQ